MSEPARLNSNELVAIGSRSTRGSPCSVCAALVCPGWESVRGGFDASVLDCIGTLRDSADEEPTVAEYHPNGTHGWSPDAPIALDYFPYNRCDVWACKACGRPFLRYIEYGGYYVDERIRELNPDHVRV
jgi:hypothetical protein